MSDLISDAERHSAYLKKWTTKTSLALREEYVKDIAHTIDALLGEISHLEHELSEAKERASGVAERPVMCD